jgi:hypothetical protein
VATRPADYGRLVTVWAAPAGAQIIYPTPPALAGDRGDLPDGHPRHELREHVAAGSQSRRS